jgi:hypothetical protein
MPRKALVTVRAALRFAHKAADERGAIQRLATRWIVWESGQSLEHLTLRRSNARAIEPLQSCEELPLDNVTSRDD